jgi:hypothetical protein
MLALLSFTPIRYCLNGIITSCHSLIESTLHPYRPELHYMRGPGPKWYAKHGRHNENGVF